MRLQEADSNGFFHSHALGLAGAARTKKPLESPSGATPNRDHTNGTVNGVLNRNNGRTGRPTASPRKSITSAWDLPALIRPLPVRQRPLSRRTRMLPHYPAVIEFVYNNRFATAFQIQKRFPSHAATLRTAQYQLANLVGRGYLNTAPVRSTSPHFPFVYFATRQGLNLVRDTYARLGVRWEAKATEGLKERGIGLDSILHELLLTEWSQTVHTTVENRHDLECLFTERRYFRRGKRLEFTENASTHRVAPDAGLLIRVRPQNSSPQLLLHFVELDNGSMSLVRIAEKLEHYAGWAESWEGQSHLKRLHRQYGSAANRPNFRLVLIAHANHHPGGDQRRMIDLLAQSLNLPSAMRDRIWLTTADQLRLHQNDPCPLDAAIWRRPRDARAWIAEYRRSTQSEDLASAQKLTLARQWVSQRLATLPRHPLLPQSRDSM